MSVHLSLRNTLAKSPPLYSVISILHFDFSLTFGANGNSPPPPTTQGFQDLHCYNADSNIL